MTSGVALDRPLKIGNFKEYVKSQCDNVLNFF